MREAISAAELEVLQNVQDLAKQVGHLTCLQILARAGAIASGILHAIGMAMRKKHGQGSSKYVLEPGWWAGLLTDGLGGAIFAAVTPLTPVEILVPMSAVAQLCFAFVCGAYVFRERSTVMQQVGFVLTVSSVALLGTVNGVSHAAEHSFHSFFKMFLFQPHVLAVHGFWLFTTLLCFVGINGATGFAVLSAYVDGLQFLFTRSIAGIVETIGVTAAMGYLSVGKALCAITAILLQQNALGEDLTSIGSLLPLLHNLTQASLGMAFFRDTVEITPALLLAMTISPVSIWLLAQTPKVRRASLQRTSERLLGDEARDPRVEGDSELQEGNCRV